MAQTHVSNDPVALRQTHMNSTRCSALWCYSMVNMWKPVDTSIVTRDTSSAEWKPIVLVDTSEQHPPTAHAIIPTFTTCFVPRTLHPIHIPRNPLSYHTPPQVHIIPTSCTAPPICHPLHLCTHTSPHIPSAFRPISVIPSAILSVIPLCHPFTTHPLCHRITSSLHHHICHHPSLSPSCLQSHSPSQPMHPCLLRHPYITPLIWRLVLTTNLQGTIG